MTRFAALSLAALLAPPALAQQPLDMPVAEVLALAAHPHLDASAFEVQLRSVLPALQTRPHPIRIPVADPFLWSIGGTFGAPAQGLPPGTLFGCARYGLATRDWFAEHGFATPQSFDLMSYSMALFDDPEVWPEGAVARLHCSFTWDDARVVAILDLDAARAALAAGFPRVDDTTAQGSEGLFGEVGYMLEARGGVSDSVVRVESAGIVLTLGHQQVMFRSFLMGGGS